MDESAPKTLPTHSARRVMKLAGALQAKSYIEIGVHAGKTFRDVSIPFRVGVDPSFRFSTEELQNENTRFHSMTSDTYFATLAPTATFDIYFLDGLHVFEQSLRDFCNALTHSHSRTVWLIDDTLPDDVYSSLPEMKDTYRFREMVGNGSTSWHGDVFKVVFFIHDFLPGLDYRTIIRSGNPQTLVWRSGEVTRKPLGMDLEKISRLTYFDMIKSIEALQQANEEAAIGSCLRAIAL